MISELLNGPILLKCVCKCYRLLALDSSFCRMQPLNDASATPLIIVCVLGCPQGTAGKSGPRGQRGPTVSLTQQTRA